MTTSKPADYIKCLTSPRKLWTRAEVLDTDAVPRKAGVYVWYFCKIPLTCRQKGAMFTTV